MTKTTAYPQVGEIGHDPVARPGRRDGPRNSLRSEFAGLMGRISTKEGAAVPIADAMACFGNGSFMALAATANAFTMIP